MVSDAHGASAADLRPPQPEGVSAWELWFGFLGGMSAFLMHLIAGVWLVPVACAWTTAPMHVLAGVFLLTALAATWVSFRVSRRLHARQRERQAQDEDGAPLAVSGAYLGAMFLGRSRLARAVLTAGAATSGTPDSANGARPPADAEELAEQRTQFMALVGLILNVIAVMFIVFTWPAILVLNPCLPGMTPLQM